MFSTSTCICFASYLACFATLLLPVFGSTRLSATAPVNPVQEGGILSLHCQVWSLQDGHDVIILRTINSGSVTQKMSLAETILDSEDERTFLAVRQSVDGSVIFFFTIMDVDINDGGVYSCRVLSSDLTVVDADSVTFDVMNFPDEIYPLCDPNEAEVVQEGVEVSFTCSSATTNPPITFQWSRTGDGTLPTASEVISDDIHTSTLSFRAAYSTDDKAVFLCEILSPEFPGKVRSCHVGPIVVMQTGKPGNDAPVYPSDFNKDHGVTTVAINSIVGIKSNSPVRNDIPHKCLEVCSSINPTDELFWIIVTIIACVLALTFIAIVIILTGKLCVLQSQAGLEHGSMTPRTMIDCHYAELETGKSDITDNSLYMSLDKTTGHYQQESRGPLPKGPYDCKYVLASSHKT